MYHFLCWQFDMGDVRINGKTTGTIKIVDIMINQMWFSYTLY